MANFTPLGKAGVSEDLITWLMSEEWPFHVNRNLTYDKVRDFVGNFILSPSDYQAFWISDAGEPRVGLLMIFDMDDIEDGAPRFDLRIRAQYRGRGLGTLAVHWMTDYLFAGWPSLRRIEGTTRGDNVAMQRVFTKNGFVKEGCLRKAWPSSDGVFYDTFLYAILREEWCAGTDAFTTQNG
ncbi:GNAT family N-acetyltransferase [Pseudomonas guariconensis]|uniref:GNAT family N-acetyltransferase n=1 Tax=Pseudomonas guariconensis TaxID=1288410 RepID=UPI003871B569